MQSNLQIQINYIKNALWYSWDLLKRLRESLEDDKKEEDNPLVIFPSLSLTIAYAALETIFSKYDHEHTSQNMLSPIYSGSLSAQHQPMISSTLDPKGSVKMDR